MPFVTNFRLADNPRTSDGENRIDEAHGSSGISETAIYLR